MQKTTGRRQNESNSVFTCIQSERQQKSIPEVSQNISKQGRQGLGKRVIQKQAGKVTVQEKAGSHSVWNRRQRLL